MDSRLSHIDILKGLLIIMVVFGHIVYIVGLRTGAELVAHSYRWTSYIANQWIAPFYMAAFFIVTGYCSSFTSSLNEQLTKDFRRLIVPAIIIPLIMKLIVNPHGVGSDYLFSILYGNMPWFLMALFTGKLIFKVIKILVSKTSIRWWLILAISALGCLLMSYNIGNNIYSVDQSLIFTLFIALGHEMRGRNLPFRWVVLSSILYILYVIFSHHIFHVSIPAICAIINFPFYFYPVYLILAIFGTSVVYWISKEIGKNRILEYFGSNSLIIYLTHTTFLTLTSLVLKDYILETSSNEVQSFLIVLLMLIGGCLWGVAWSWLLNRRYMKWIIGK